MCHSVSEYHLLANQKQAFFITVNSTMWTVHIKALAVINVILPKDLHLLSILK